MEHPLGRDISHIKITAALAVVVLVGVGVWQVAGSFNEKSAAETFTTTSDGSSGAQSASVAAVDATSSDNGSPLSTLSQNALGEVVGAYAGLQQEGIYSSTTAANIATSIGSGLQAPVSYTPISASDVKTSPDTSYSAMMQYRASLQTSLKPLLSNTEPEYEIFGMYVETGQETYLEQLREAAANYVLAASSTAALTVPADAVQVQVGLVNSMNEFAATLDQLADQANDPISSTVLLENYNQAENDVLTAFQALVTYEQSKTQ